MLNLKKLNVKISHNTILSMTKAISSNGSLKDFVINIINVYVASFYPQRIKHLILKYIS